MIRRTMAMGWVVAGLIHLIGPIHAQSIVVKVGVVTDGAGAEAGLLEKIRTALEDLRNPDITVEFRQASAYNAGWDPSKAAEAVRSALGDREVDLVVGFGPLVTRAAARPDQRLSKPFVSAFVQRSDFLDLPYSKENRSLKNNLSLIVIPNRIAREVATFQQMVGFETLHVGVDPTLVESVEAEREKLAAYEDLLGIRFVLVPIAGDVAGVLSQLGTDVEAFYLTQLPRLDTGARKGLIQTLTTRTIPTFSSAGHPDVTLGALAALTPDISTRVARRVALNIDRINRGTAVKDLPVLLGADARLMINGRTAGAVGYTPSSEERISATFLHPDELAGHGVPLGFNDALNQAQNSNTALRSKQFDVEIAREDRNGARSVLLPQASLFVKRFWTDDDLEISSRGIIPDDGSSAGLQVQQLIFSDQAFGAYRSSDRLFKSREHTLEMERLDVLAAAGRAYLGHALRRALYRVDTENLRLTEDHLEMARLRAGAGYSGQSEVYRWEAELAQRRSALFASEAAVESARLALNQTIGAGPATRTLPATVSVDSDGFESVHAWLESMTGGRENLETVRTHLVESALESAPEVKALEEAIAAQDIQLGQQKRRFVLPTISADLTVNKELEGDGGTVPTTDDTFWAVRIAASYPIFQGGSKMSGVRRARAGLEGLELQKEFVRELVDVRTRTAVRRLEASFPTIRFSLEAAESAEKNLRVVQDLYAEGTVNVTDLLEAQTVHFAAKQAAESSVYAFLIDYVDLQRSLSWFDATATSREREAFWTRVMSGRE